MTKEPYFADTSVSVKYNKTLKTLLLQHSASPHAIYVTRLSSQAVYFIQTGSSALSNTYLYNYLCVCVCVCVSVCMCVCDLTKPFLSPDFVFREIQTSILNALYFSGGFIQSRQISCIISVVI